jgi:SPP1 family predicted phage head-tail adaptor
MTVHVQAGELRNPILIREKVEEPQDDGTVTTVLQDVVEWSGKIQPIGGKEYWQAQQAQSQTTHRIIMRSYSGLSAKRHVLVSLVDDRVFEIESVADIDGRGVLMEVMCKEMD